MSISGIGSSPAARPDQRRRAHQLGGRLTPVLGQLPTQGSSQPRAGLDQRGNQLIGDVIAVAR